MLFRKLSQEEEAEFRLWARQNYQPNSEIKGIWHPVIQDECVCINREQASFVKEPTHSQPPETDSTR